MKRFLAVLVALMLVFSACAVAEEEKVLNIFTWEGYVDDVTLGQFMDETGIQVNFQTFATNEEMLLKLQANGGSEYDIIIASDYIIAAAAQEGLLLPLDKAQLTNWENLNPDYLDQYFDPANVYSMPYTVGSPLIVYDPAQVEGEVTAFSDLWDEQFADGLWLLDDARVMLGETLKSLGYSYNTTEAAELVEAANKLTEIKPNVSILNYDMSYDYLAAGEVKAAYLFTPFAALCMMANPSLEAVYPSEGIGFGIDSIVVPVNAPHPTNAHTFMNFYLRPEIAKHVAEWQLYINPNQAADALIDPSITEMAPFNIPEELLETKEYVQPLGEDESIFQDIWNSFKLAD